MDIVDHKLQVLVWGLEEGEEEQAGRSQNRFKKLKSSSCIQNTKLAVMSDANALSSQLIWISLSDWTPHEEECVLCVGYLLLFTIANG